MEIRKRQNILLSKGTCEMMLIKLIQLSPSHILMEEVLLVPNTPIHSLYSQSVYKTCDCITYGVNCNIALILNLKNVTYHCDGSTFKCSSQPPTIITIHAFSNQGGYGCFIVCIRNNDMLYLRYQYSLRQTLACTRFLHQALFLYLCISYVL